MGNITQLSEAQIDDRFFVSGSHPVGFLLGELIRQQITFSIHFDGEMFLSSLLAIDARSDELVFDCSGCHETNQQLLLSKRAIFVAKSNGVSVQFSSAEVRAVLHGHHKALAISLPARVMRLQRRECFRIETPCNKPIEFTGTLAGGGAINLPVANMSISGVGLLAHQDISEIEPLTKLTRCAFLLPDTNGAIMCAAVVRHATEVANRFGVTQWRLGLQLEGVSAGDQGRIQRYITTVERARHELT